MKNLNRKIVQLNKKVIDKILNDKNRFQKLTSVGLSKNTLIGLKKDNKTTFDKAILLSKVFDIDIEYLIQDKLSTEAIVYANNFIDCKQNNNHYDPNSMIKKKTNAQRLKMKGVWYI